MFLFVCLIHTSSRLHVRTCERYLKWFFTSFIHDKSKKMMIAQISNRRRRFFWLTLVSHRRRRFSWFKLSFVIVSHSSWCLVSDLHSLCRVHIIEWSVQTSKRLSLLSNDLKTIKFSQIELLNFISRLKFLFRTQFVHAKTTFSCDRRYYKERDDDRWWWSANDVTFCFSLKAKMLSYCQNDDSETIKKKKKNTFPKT